MTNKSCFWLLTENNNPDQYRAGLEVLFETSDNITYICGQLEEGTHRHFQGYIQLKIAKPISWLKNNVSKTAHFEIQFKKASAEQGRHYASKPHHDCICKECDAERADPTVIPDTFVEYGIIRKKGQGAGQRTDLLELRQAIIENKTERSIILDDNMVQTYARHMKFYDRVRALFPPPPLQDGVDVRLYVGSPGTGKTRKAYTNEDLYEVPIDNGTKWYDGYDQHKVILFDDFAGKVDHVTLVNTLKLFDRYVRKLPIKGAHTWLRSEIVIVTSNYHPRKWYEWKDREESYEALTRRFKSVTVFEHDEEVVYNTKEQVSEYFYDKDLWPTETRTGHFSREDWLAIARPEGMSDDDLI